MDIMKFKKFTLFIKKKNTMLHSKAADQVITEEHMFN